MKVLMLGCDKSTKGGMWKVVENYLLSEKFSKTTNLCYIPTSITGKIHKKLSFTFKAYCKILFHFFKDRPDILHVHMSERGSVFRKGIPIYLATVFKTKVIIHMHGAEFEVWYDSLGAFGKKIVKNILNKGDAIVILGDYWRGFLSRICPNNKIYVLHNAVYVPTSNNYNTESNTLLFLGVVGQRKGSYDLLEAFSKCVEKIPDNIELLYYGPNFENKIVSYIEKSKLSRRVKYMGWLSERDKETVFKNTLINILPSYNEGLPMTILETMSYGIPNISTAVAAIPEVVEEENGILIEPGNINQLSEAIIKLVNNKEERNLKSRNAYMTVKDNFSITAHITRLLDIYSTVLERKNNESVNI